MVPLPPPPDSGIYIGKSQIREWLQPQLQQFHMAARNYRVTGNTVTWDGTVSGDLFRHMGIDAFEVTAIGKVQRGKITSFTMTQTQEAHRKFQAARWQTGAARSDAMT